jgi:hypothetical protein
MNTQERFESLLPYVSYIVDDAGSGRVLGADPHAIVRKPDNPEFKHPSRLVVFQCGFEPLVVAVHSYLDVHIDDADAEDMAIEYLEEIGWFSDEYDHQSDYII